MARLASMFDVGGQRSERRKWVHCFEGVTALLFVASLPGYDESLVEDRDSNAMTEALILFDSLVNARWFASSATLLFLNKTDVFKQRLVRSPLTRYFPDYDGDPADYNAARAYFQKRFARLNRSPSKEGRSAFFPPFLSSLLMSWAYSLRPLHLRHRHDRLARGHGQRD